MNDEKLSFIKICLIVTFLNVSREAVGIYSHHKEQEHSPNKFIHLITKELPPTKEQ